MVNIWNHHGAVLLPVSEVFRYYSGTRLVFLTDIAAVLGLVFIGSRQLRKSGRSDDMDLGGSELGVVEEKGSLGRRLFFKRHRGRLAGRGFIGCRRDREVTDLSTAKTVLAAVNKLEQSWIFLPEAEEIAHLLLTGLAGYAFDVDGSRHAWSLDLSVEGVDLVECTE
jgi:hypothetical protein